MPNMQMSKDYEQIVTMKETKMTSNYKKDA